MLFHVLNLVCFTILSVQANSSTIYVPQNQHHQTALLDRKFVYLNNTHKESSSPSISKNLSINFANPTKATRKNSHKLKPSPHQTKKTPESNKIHQDSWDHYASETEVVYEEDLSVSAQIVPHE